jgi:two-component system NtrC family sensor kinase
MHPYLILPFVSGVLCIALSIATWVSRVSPGMRAAMGRLRWLMLIDGVWALSEVLWNFAEDPAVETVLVRVWSAALVLIGPVAFDLTNRIQGRPTRTALRRQRFIYTAAGILVGLSLAMPLVASGLETMSWGRVLIPGPLYTVVWVFSIGLCIGGVVNMQAQMKSPSARGKGSSRRFLLAAIAAPVVIAGFTDVIMPVIGIPFPRLASTFLGTFAVAVIWLLGPRQIKLIGSPELFAYEILRTLSDGVALITLDDRILTANDKLAELLGVEPGALAARPLQRHLPQLDLSQARELRDYECMLRIDDQNEIFVSVSLCPLFDDRAGALGLVVVVRDEREVERLRNQVVLSGRLAAVGQLAAGIAHEINNPLAFTRSNLGMIEGYWAELQKEIPVSRRSKRLEQILADGEDVVGESIEGLDRATAIVRDVREFSHSGESGRQPTDINSVLDGVVRIAAPELGHQIQLVRAYGEVPFVSASSQQLGQVFLNLLVNAIHAVENDGEIRLATRVDGEHVVIEFTDNGPGISKELADRIFDPFYTTKPVGKGTGLGLSISYGIVRSHGGELSAGSGPGGGACLQVRLPIGDIE